MGSAPPSASTRTGGLEFAIRTVSFEKRWTDRVPMHRSAWLLLFAFGSAACGAYAQEGGAVDSLRKALPEDTLLTREIDTWRSAGREGLGQLTDSAKAASKRLLGGPRRVSTHGELALWGAYGRLPMTASGSAPWNGGLRGHVDLLVKGLPFDLDVDVGTDRPLRGQRQRVQLSFDAAAFAQANKWAMPKALHEADHRLDSLQQVERQLSRDLRGAWMAHAAAAARAALPTVTLPDTAGVADTLTQAVDTLTGPSTSEPAPLADSLSVEGLPPGVGPGLPEVDQQRALDRVDSLEHLLRQVREVIDLQQQQAGLQQALARADPLAGTRIGKALSGLRRFQVGLCTPPTAELLLDGVTFRGVSAEYAVKDFSIAVDHGASFDEAWQNGSPTEQQVNALHQSLFLTDAQDLAPKKITAIRLGAGDANKTYTRVGFLTGRSPYYSGANNSVIDPALRNQVLAVEGGVRFAKVHQVRGAYARSIVSTGPNGEGGTSATTGDLFSGESRDAQAVKLNYAVDIERWGTRIDVGGRSIGPAFHNIGLAFIRRDSRAGTVDLEQRIGRKLRVRLRHLHERRGVTEADAEGGVWVDRSSVQVMARPLTGWSVRASYVPVTVRRSGIAPGVQFNQLVTVGTDGRKRWGGTTGTAGIDASWFEGGGSPGMRAAGISGNAYVSVVLEQGLIARVNYMRAMALGVRTAVDQSDLGATVEAELKRAALRLGAGVNLPMDGPVGWSVSGAKAIANAITVRIDARRISPTRIFFPQDDLNNETDGYTCQLTVLYAW